MKDLTLCTERIPLRILKSFQGGWRVRKGNQSGDIGKYLGNKQSTVTIDVADAPSVTSRSNATSITGKAIQIKRIITCSTDYLIYLYL
jgi:hypothetical protein